METVDEVIRDKALEFIDKASQQNKPFFVWLNPTRMHVITHLSPKYESMRTPENGWSVEEAGMAQLDDVVGAVLAHLSDNGLENNTIVIFTTDNGAENFTWPDGGRPRSLAAKGQPSKAVSAYPALSVGPAMYPPGRWRTASYPGSIGFLLWWQPPAIRTSPQNC
jgi:arylsulfatase